MKYMTKDWYEIMQKTSLDSLLRVSKKAGVFSEDYFKKLYNNEEKAWLKLKEKVSRVKFEDITAYNPEQEKKNFKQALQYIVKHYERNLPGRILQKIADIRVLALKHASADIKREITAYCKANEKAVKLAIKTYCKEYKKSFKDDEPAFAENFKFHDCKVIYCRKKGKDIVLTLDNSSGFTTISQIIFKDSSILKQDKLLLGATWLYNEIYKTNDGYEIHVLLQKDELIDYIVAVTEVEYR